MLNRCLYIIRSEGLTGLFRRSFQKLLYGGEREAIYHKWIQGHETWDPVGIRAQIGHLKYRPLISVIMPVYNTEPEFLDACIQSVVDQYYENWELCIYDDASTEAATLECLRKWQDHDDPRIKIRYGTVNSHISLASNEAIAMAAGEFIAILDHDDVLAPVALFANVRLLNENPDADLIYSDQDKMDVRGRRSEPLFKPDWSPELLMSVNYINHLCVIRKEVGDSVGWFRRGYEGSQDFDLFLRITSMTDRIFHIPEILYHWRSTPTSTAGNILVKDYCTAAGIKALNDHLGGHGWQAQAHIGENTAEYHVRFEVQGEPMVSIILPFKDKVGLLRNCLDKLLRLSTYNNYEILLIANNCEEDETFEFLERLENEADPRIRIFRHDVPFNFSAINNWGVEQAMGEFLLFLNNDTEVITPRWIEDMLGYAQRPEIGAVGPKLFFEEGTIQHAGVIVGIGGFADHIFSEFYENTFTAFGKDTWSRNYLAVTAACMMVERRKFAQVGRFNEEFVVCGSDVELGLRLYQAGYRNVYLSFVKLYHFESQTRIAAAHNEKDVECSKRYYAPYLATGDPYYNKSLTLEKTDGNYF
ncbi:MAG: glycosyltransferase family 2 protein [Thermoleophilia bacterium]